MTKQVPCDYCGISNESKSIFSLQKSFVGHKMLDILQIVTHQTLAANLAVKVCLMCASNLMTTMGVVKKAQTMVENASLAKSAAAKNKKASPKSEDSDEPQGSSPIVDLTGDGGGDVKGTPPINKNLKLRQRSKSMVASPTDLIFPRSPAKKADELKGTPSKKTPKKDASCLEDTLDNSVRLTPAKEVAANKKVFLQLFGSRNGDDVAPESEDEDDEEEEDKGSDEPADKVIHLIKDFDCKLCDFHTRVPKHFKEHLSQEHGQPRPRIYFCNACPKSFGLLKSWKTHLGSAHGLTVEKPQKEVKVKAAKVQEQQAKGSDKEPLVEPVESPVKGKAAKAQEQKAKGSEPFESPVKGKAKKTPPAEEIQEQANELKLATIKPLNGEAVAAKKKWLEQVINNADYTFAINGSSASTPKASDESSGSHNEYKCDICDSVLPTAKQMQDHMKSAHGIDKPKIFKCHVCEKALTTKQTLKHHMNLHSEGAEAEKSSKRKILQEEKDVDSVDSLTKKKGSAQEEEEQDDDKPREEKIQHTEKEGEGGRKSLSPTKKDKILMAPPKSPSKKPKKEIPSSSQMEVITDSPSKKGKRKNKDNNTSLSETTITTVDLLDEINTNVKPHKKARLQSLSDSLCSSIDGYSTTDESILSCNQCGKHVKSHQRLATHIKKRHGTKLECPGCRTGYHNQRDYVNHFAICNRNSGSLLPCGVNKCKKSFFEANFLSDHLRKKHQWE